MESAHNQSSPGFYHGTKANLKTGDLIEAGYNSNYGGGNVVNAHGACIVKDNGGTTCLVNAIVIPVTPLSPLTVILLQIL